MQRADVAVVVPVYNRAHAVLATLDSVQRQTVLPKRLIVADDGSTDGTAQSARNWFAETRPPFETIIVTQSNQGAGAARNRGFQEVGDCGFVAFLDSDDRWPADFLARAVARLEPNHNAVAATADRQFLRSFKRRLGKRSSQGLEQGATEWFLSNNSGIASCTLFRSSIVKRLAGFDVTLPTGQDAEFFLRASLLGPWLHVPGEPVHFYVGFTGAQGEASNLSTKYADRYRRWVRIRERFIFRQGGSDAVSEKTYRRLLAHHWHKAGRMYECRDRHASAIACFHKALQYQPARLRTWYQLGMLRAALRLTPARTLHPTLTINTDLSPGNSKRAVA